MDNLRFFLFVLLVLTGYMLWAAWQQDYGPRSPLPGQQPGTEAKAPEESAISGSEAQASSMAEEVSAGKVSVRTDVMHVEIDLAGGDIQLVDLLKYPVSKDKPDEPVRLLTPDLEKLFITQSGFLGDERIAPPHTVIWEALEQDFVMEGEQTLKVPLAWRGEGVEIVKTFIFEPGSYEVQIEYQVRNQSQVPWSARQYGQLKRKRPTKARRNTFIRTFTGVACHTVDDPYEKIKFNDIEELPRNWETEGGWCAMIQHYFIAAWLPPEDQINHFYTKAMPEQVFIVGSYSPEYRVSPGENRSFRARYYIGPKLQNVLETVAPGLELTVDYGIFTFIAEPIFWLMQKFFSYFGNWGWAIICTTMVIKAIFFPLSAASYKSMAKMRKLQPRMEGLKERLGDDKQKFHEALMQLYREEKVNPLGGCLPIMVQIPVFISLYWVLVESVELRQASFVLWLTDLTSKDPYFILPLLMGVSMWIQQKLSPPPTDPVQAQVMKLFPVIFTVFFAFFPAGLVLYWVVNNTLSIVQQWVINRQIEGTKKA